MTKAKRVHFRHIRAAGIRLDAARRWVSTHGFDWDELVNKGLPRNKIAKADALGARMAAVADLEVEHNELEMISDIRVWPRHVRMAGICMKGSRNWFKQHGLSWGNFVEEGLAVEVVESKNCPIANRVAAAAREEAAALDEEQR
jgi:hypothetical protein